MEAPCCSTRAPGALAQARPCGAERRGERNVRCSAAPRHDQKQRKSTSGPSEQPSSRRRTLGLLLAAAPALLAALPPPAAAEPAADMLESSGKSSSSSSTDVDTTVTDRLYLDVGLCPEAVRTDRRLGDKTPFCQQPEPVGRIVIDLYGRAAPGSVATIVAAAKAGAYADTTLSKVLPGRYIVAGAQGPKRSGLVQAPEGLPPNPDLLNSSAFRLSHRRPGTVSLNLSESEDEDFLRFSKGYRNLGLLITTGPGPVPSLDGENIVVGQVAEGLDVVAAITQVPTFEPNDNSRAFNQFANFIGDDRAAKTASKWGRPLQAVVITGCGVL